jgi:hypothetical protein
VPARRCGREADRQSAQHPHSEEGEALGLDRVAAPTDRLGWLAADGGALAQHVHQHGVAAPATADDEPHRPARQQVERLSDRGGGEGGQRRGAVLEPEPVGHDRTEIEPVERLGIGCREIGMGE